MELQSSMQRRIEAEMGDTQKRKPCIREVNTSHAIFLLLQHEYGLGSFSHKRSRASKHDYDLEHLNVRLS